MNYSAQPAYSELGGFTKSKVGKDGRGEINISINSKFGSKAVDGLVKEAFDKIVTIFH